MLLQHTATRRALDSNTTHTSDKERSPSWSIPMALPRLLFPFPTRTTSWFAGHMARSLRELPALLDEVDLVLEARDSRLPLTSVNPAFDAVLERAWGHSGSGPDRKGKGKEKIVVYTKRDLAEERYEAVRAVVPPLGPWAGENSNGSCSGAREPCPCDTRPRAGVCT